MESKIKATEEQRAYAWFLDWGMKIGLAMLVVTFGMYLFGVMKPYVPVQDLVNGDWALPVHGKEGHPGYLEKQNIHAGWWWLSQIGKGDFVNFLGIAFRADFDFTPILLEGTVEEITGYPSGQLLAGTPREVTAH